MPNTAWTSSITHWARAIDAPNQTTLTPLSAATPGLVGYLGTPHPTRGKVLSPVYWSQHYLLITAIHTKV